MEVDRDSLRAQILDLEECLLKPDIRQSPEEINKLLADDWFEVGSYGAVWHKKDCENGLTLFKMTIYDFHIHLLANDVVLATYRVIDETRMITTRRSSIWKYRDDRWQMFYHQSTIIHDR